MRRPTERRASLAAKQLAHHRERLPWMQERMEENERTTTRIAEIAAWFTRRVLSPKNTAAAMASAATTPICAAPTPIIRTRTSATPSPTATPTATSKARRPRSPGARPSVTTAATGAKKGCSLPSTKAARK